MIRVERVGMSGRKNKRWERERNLKGVGTSLGDVDGARDSRTGIIYIYEYKLIPSPRAGMVGESLAFALPCAHLVQFGKSFLITQTCLCHNKIIPYLFHIIIITHFSQSQPFFNLHEGLSYHQPLFSNLLLSWLLASKVEHWIMHVHNKLLAIGHMFCTLHSASRAKIYRWKNMNDNP